MSRVKAKEERQKKLALKIEEDPFLTDGELAKIFNVSIPTIRFDRAALGIAEYRQRVKNVAYKKQSGFSAEDNTNMKVVDFAPMASGVFTFKTDKSMTFPGSDIVRGCYIYSFAETLAIKVINQNAAIIDVANIKYKRPIIYGSSLMASSQVIRTRDNEYIVWVKIHYKNDEVFRCKFMLRAVMSADGRIEHENCR